MDELIKFLKAKLRSHSIRSLNLRDHFGLAPQELLFFRMRKDWFAFLWQVKGQHCGPWLNSEICYSILAVAEHLSAWRRAGFISMQSNPESRLQNGRSSGIDWVSSLFFPRKAHLGALATSWGSLMTDEHDSGIKLLWSSWGQEDKLYIHVPLQAALSGLKNQASRHTTASLFTE